MIQTISTQRLTLVPATVAHVRAEIGDGAAFAALLQAQVPHSWPPEGTTDALPLFLQWLEAAPDAVGWFNWYALAQEDGARVLVGGGGFLGPPQDGEVGLGYSVLPEYQGRGFATELARGLVQWAMAQAAVQRIVAETEWANPASARVLHKLGFAQTGPGSEPGNTRFELPRHPVAAWGAS